MLLLLVFLAPALGVDCETRRHVERAPTASRHASNRLPIHENHRYKTSWTTQQSGAAGCLTDVPAGRRVPGHSTPSIMYGPPRHAPVQSEAEAARDRRELKAWRVQRVATLAARRRAVRVLRGDLTSPPRPARRKRRRRAPGAVPPTPTNGTEVETPAKALASPLLTATAAAKGRKRSEGKAMEAEGEVRIFDHFLVVGLPSRLVEHPDVSINARYSPKVLHHLSPTGAPTEAEAIADFCMPAGAKVSAAPAGEGRRPGALNSMRGVKEVIFVLSGGGKDGSRVQYGVCAHASRFYESVGDDNDRPPLVEVDVCYCLVTQFPFLPLHFAVLRSAIRAEVEAFETRKHPRSRRYAAAHAVLKAYAKVPPPLPGGLVRINELAWTRPKRRRAKASRAPRDEATRLAREWSLPVVLGRLSLENVLRVLACALLELRVVFVSRDLQTLSACALGAVSLLRPLRWAGPLISALPADLRDYLDSPVPLILGVTGLPLHFEQGADMVLAFADEDRVRLPVGEDIELPRGATLIENLQPLVDLLRSELRGVPLLPPLSTQNTRTSADAASAFGDEPCEEDDLDGERAPSPGWARAPSPKALKALDDVVDGVHAHLRLLLSGARALRQARDLKRRVTKAAVAENVPSLQQMLPEHVWNGLGGDQGFAFLSRVEQTQMYSNYHHHEPTSNDDAAELLRRLDEDFDDGVESSSSSECDTEEDVTETTRAFWCQGRCGGALDTPFCTAACLEQWERNARLEKQRELQKVVGHQRLREPLKHRNETRSQWSHRASLHAQPSPQAAVAKRPPFGFHTSVDPRGFLCCDKRSGGTAAPVRNIARRRPRTLVARPMAQRGYAGRGPSTLALARVTRRSEDRRARVHDAALVLQRKARRDRLCRALEAAALAARRPEVPEMEWRPCTVMDALEEDLSVASEESLKLRSPSVTSLSFLVDPPLAEADEKPSVVAQLLHATKARVLYEALAAWRDRFPSDDESDLSDAAPRAPSPVDMRAPSPPKPSPVAHAAAALVDLMEAEDTLAPPAPPPLPPRPNSQGTPERPSPPRASPAERRTLLLRDSFGVEELEDFDDDASGADLSSRGSGGDLPSLVSPPKNTEASPVEETKPPPPPPPPPSPPPQDLMSPAPELRHFPARSLSCSSDDAALSLRRVASPIARPMAAEEIVGYDDVEFRAALRQGFVAVKHGRRGKAHVRRFRASEDLTELSWAAEDEPSSVVHAGLRRLKRFSKGYRVVRMADVVQVCGRGSSRVLQRAHSAGTVARPFTVSLVLNDGASVDLEFQDAAKHRAMLRGFTRLAAASRKLDGELDPWEEAVEALAVKAGPE